MHGLDPIARGNGILAMAVAMSVGAFAYGPIERWLRGPKLAVLAGNIIAGAAFVILGVTVDLATGAAIAALAIAGGFGMTYALLMAHARQFFPDRLLGRGVTFPQLRVHQRSRPHPGRVGPVRAGRACGRAIARGELCRPPPRLRRRAARRNRHLCRNAGPPSLIK